MEDYSNISQAVLQWGAVEHDTGKWSVSLLKKLDPVTNSRLEVLEAESQAMKSTICAMNEYLTEAKNMSADNQKLVI